MKRPLPREEYEARAAMMGGLYDPEDHTICQIWRYSGGCCAVWFADEDGTKYAYDPDTMQRISTDDVYRREPNGTVTPQGPEGQDIPA